MCSLLKQSYLDDGTIRGGGGGSFRGSEAICLLCPPFFLWRAIRFAPGKKRAGYTGIRCFPSSTTLTNDVRAERRAWPLPIAEGLIKSAVASTHHYFQQNPNRGRIEWLQQLPLLAEIEITCGDTSDGGGITDSGCG